MEQAEKMLSAFIPQCTGAGLAPALFLAAFLSSTIPASGKFLVAEKGKARCDVLLASDALEPEKFAFQELTNTLAQITGANFKIVATEQNLSDRVILVGESDAAKKLFPEINLAEFGSEEFVIKNKGKKLLLAGGKPRGTIYAVNRFLQDQCGVRWWTPWATNLPHRATLEIPNLNQRGKSAFEYRAPFWFAGFDPQWKVHNGVNSEFREIPAAMGGCIKYKGFAHTFYPLVPPSKYFSTNPEWFSFRDGQRTTNRAQLCLTNPKLRNFVVGRVKEWLHESPEAKIISVTQNDWAGWCECESCKALDDAEESHAGSLLHFVNYIAEKIEPEFPDVAVDTFAYQYTRKAPKTIRPRRNVIVRLCSIECNFREPLDHPSNAAFLSDLNNWSKICSHLYVWDYTTDFKNYIHPHPNWFTLGPNVRLFQKFGVQGLFEQGAYQGYGAEMAEMRSWVLAQLLWNPQQNDRKLIREFLDGYFGEAAAKPIFSYLELMHKASEGVYLSCFLRKDQSQHLNFSALARAEQFWREAERATEHDPEKNQRVRLAHLPVRCAFLKNWQRLHDECDEQKAAWPLPGRNRVVEEFREVSAGLPGKDWTHVSVMSEHGLTVEDFLKKFEKTEK
jgi:hypothetical protein